MNASDWKRKEREKSLGDNGWNPGEILTWPGNRYV